MTFRGVAARLLLGTLAPVATCASAQAATLDGAALSWPWALPFAGLLLTNATAPLLVPKLWHHH